jgi:excisionase family DNA binding protein
MPWHQMGDPEPCKDEHSRDELLTPEEVALILRLKPGQIRWLLEKRRLGFIRIGPRGPLRIARAELDRFLEEGHRFRRSWSGEMAMSL